MLPNESKNLTRWIFKMFKSVGHKISNTDDDAVILLILGIYSKSNSS